jgi:multidrug efflux pump subunit AcrA (membrane-fusion protein)
VSVNVRKEFHPNAIVVPRTAVFQSESGSNVFTVSNLPNPPAGASGGGGAAKGGAGARGQAGPPVRLMQAHVVPVEVGLQTDTLTEVRSPQIQAGTTVVTTRPDALQDKSVVAISAPGNGAQRGAQ